MLTNEICLLRVIYWGKTLFVRKEEKGNWAHGAPYRPGGEEKKARKRADRGEAETGESRRNLLLRAMFKEGRIPYSRRVEVEETGKKKKTV